MKTLAWLLRTFFCTIWLLSGLLFVVTISSGLAETDPNAANPLMIRAAEFGFIMLVAMLAHSYLLSEHKKKYPPKDDGDYPNWDIE